jgi:hypothetical protein
MRWLHIYLSLFGLAAILFFSVTGITLNHPDWFFGESERTVQSEGKVEARWLNLPAPESTKTEELSDSQKVAKLEIVEHLRKSHNLRGALTEFKVDDRECSVTFKGPGYAADAYIERESGTYKLTETLHGFIAVINDLHKGRDTGPIWSIVLDISAIMMTIVSLTGLILLFYLKRRRVSGTLIGLVGLVVFVALYWYFVP